MKSTTAFKTGRVREPKDEDNFWENLVESNLQTNVDPSIDRIFASRASLCERQTAGLMKLNGDSSSTRKASAQFYFGTGNTFEDIMARAFKKAGVMIDRETRVEFYHEDLPVSGRIDFVLKDPKSPTPLLMELKTCGKLPRRPKPAHEAQLRTYLAITGMPRGLLWYVSRSVAGWDGVLLQKTFLIEPTEIQTRNTILTVALGSVYGQTKFLPDRPERLKRYQCGFCPLIPFCWEDKDVGLEYEEPEPEDKLALLKAAEVIVEEVMGEQASLRREFIKMLESDPWGDP